MKFRKKPVEVEAFALTGGWDSDSWRILEDFTNHLVRAHHPKGAYERYWVYDRLHDTWVEFEVGDWIIKGVQGEFYPIKPDVLEETYERL